MANVAPKPWQLAFESANQKKAQREWVIKNKNRIRNIYKRVAGLDVSEEKINRMAQVRPHAFEELQNMIQYDQFRSIHEDAFGNVKFTGGKGKKRKGARKRSTLNEAMSFYGNLRRKYETPEAYQTHVGAILEVNKFKEGTDIERRMVNLFGFNNLVKAQEGRAEFQGLRSKSEYFRDLDPIMRQRFGRGATLADVERISAKYSSANDYNLWLTAGVTAAGLSRQISEGGLQGFGTEADLQQSISQAGGDAGDLQARINEARVKRQAQFEKPASSVTSSETESGFVTQDLF